MERVYARLVARTAAELLRVRLSPDNGVEQRPIARGAMVRVGEWEYKSEATQDAAEVSVGRVGP